MIYIGGLFSAEENNIIILTDSIIKNITTSIGGLINLYTNN